MARIDILFISLYIYVFLLQKSNFQSPPFPTISSTGILLVPLCVIFCDFISYFLGCVPSFSDPRLCFHFISHVGDTHSLVAPWVRVHSRLIFIVLVFWEMSLTLTLDLWLTSYIIVSLKSFSIRNMKSVLSVLESRHHILGIKY